jgi:hypothetical protein
MHFMSIEVEAQMFLFSPYHFSHPANVREKVRQMRQTEEQAATSAAHPQAARLPFSHNHLHDLESLWWVVVWMVFYNKFSKSKSHQSDEEPLSDLRETGRQLAVARTLFPPSTESIRRRDGFQRSFATASNGLPHNKKNICDYLEILRQSLVEDYIAIESTHPKFINSTASNDDIYDGFKEAFRDSHAEYSDFVLTFIPEIHAQLKENLKRPRAESIDETGVVPRKKK